MKNLLLIVIFCLFLGQCKAPAYEKALAPRAHVARITSWEQDPYMSRHGVIYARVTWENGWSTYVLLPEEFKDQKFVEILIP